MQQYLELKGQAGDALLLFRMGDFYELFGDDAVVASKILDITLTSRDKNKPNPLPMAGVPHHSYLGYLQKLLRAGHKVALAEQMEDPAAAKGIVKRAITRTFTPAIQFEHETSEASYLAAVAPEQSAGSHASVSSRWSITFLDPSTGESRFSGGLSVETLTSVLGAHPVKHVLDLGLTLPPEARAALAPGTLVEALPSNYLTAVESVETLKKQYGVLSFDAFGADEASLQALGLLVTYCLRTQKQERLLHLRPPRAIGESESMRLGPRTAQHLDLFPDLFELINRTKSALGARALRRWLVEPLARREKIMERQNAVRALGSRPEKRKVLCERLAQVYDLERLCGRLNARLANPRDTLALGRSLSELGLMGQSLQGVGPAPLLDSLAAELDELGRELEPFAKRVLTTQNEGAPLVSRDGGIFARGTTPELDRLLNLTEDGEKWLVEFETREREVTGIPSLKVKYNRVFGYSIEITSAHAKKAPAHYFRKQTMAGAERFFTEELKKFEEEILSASGKRKALELQLFEILVDDARLLVARFMRAAALLAELDAVQSLAALTDWPGWIFPEFDDSTEIDIEGGRHPVVDAAARGHFVPNDLKLLEARTLLITGPNMGGKSTVMRQVALIVILGQMGAPVPARRARWGVVSSVLTRIGAHDAIARGQSTFMVEMTELAYILHHADERSLLVLDEIGRGTSTYDGVSVAWAALEWITARLKSRTLFATHYHELTRLSAELPGIVNAHMAVEGGQGSADPSAPAAKLRFLYELRPGAVNDSFGIHVAELAGVPSAVISRAWQVLSGLEGKTEVRTSPLRAQESRDFGQLGLFGFSDAPSDAPGIARVAPGIARVAPAVPTSPILAELETADLNALTPIQAMNFLAAIQGRLHETAKRSS